MKSRGTISTAIQSQHPLSTTYSESTPIPTGRNKHPQLQSTSTNSAIHSQHLQLQATLTAKADRYSQQYHYRQPTNSINTYSQSTSVAKTYSQYLKSAHAVTKLTSHQSTPTINTYSYTHQQVTI